MDERLTHRALRWLPPVAAVVAHVTYVANGFAWLDHLDLERGHARVPLAELPGAFVSRYGETPFYRPLVTWLHSLDWAIGGGAPWVFHLTNVLLHVAVAAAAVPFARAMLRLPDRACTIVGLVVAVHPLTWLVVGQIAFRADLLMTLFTLLAVIFHARARGGGRSRDAVLAAVAMLAALGAKETAVVYIPALLVLSEVCAHLDRAARTRKWIFAAELGALAAWALLRMVAVPEVWSVHETSNVTVGTHLALLARRLLDLVRPAVPPLSDATPLVGPLDPWAVAGALAIVAGIAICVRLGVRSAVTRTLALLAIALSPALALIPLPRLSSPHYAYFALVPFAMLVALGWERLRAVVPRSRHRALDGIGAAALAALAIVTVGSGSRHRDDQSLFGPEVEADPCFREGRAYLAHHAADARAATLLEEALRGCDGVVAYVDRSSAQVNLAGIRLRQGRFDAAEALLADVAPHAPPHLRETVAYDRALVAARQRDFPRVVELLAPTEDGWDRPEPLMLLGQALIHTGRSADAARVLRRALPMLEGEQRNRVEGLLLALPDAR